jgi:amidohydrolase
MRGVFLLPLLFIAAPVQAEPDYAAAIRADYDTNLAPLFDYFHRNPELSFREVNTAARMAKELRAIPGIVVTEKVGQTGVVGVMKNGAGPTVLIRADMDGLPVEEKSGLANASKARQVGVDGKESPVMHACGHDTHITGMIATAKRLAAMKDRWAGTIVFVVQPAEEALGGAKAMVDDGIYTRFPKPDYALAYHVGAELQTGQVSASEDIQYSSSDALDITVRGIATHGASPQLGRDPVYIASQMVVAFQGIISREKGPLTPGVITVGAFNAGNRPNIISDHADLQVTVRANDEVTRAQLIAAIRRASGPSLMVVGVPAVTFTIGNKASGKPLARPIPSATRRMAAIN